MRLSAPSCSTALAVKTNSPSDNLAGISSEVPVPGPSTGPAPVNSEAVSTTLSNKTLSCGLAST
jgi:hypothetical protein